MAPSVPDTRSWPYNIDHICHPFRYCSFLCDLFLLHIDMASKFPHHGLAVQPRAWGRASGTYFRKLFPCSELRHLGERRDMSRPCPKPALRIRDHIIWLSRGPFGAARRRLFPLALSLAFTWRTGGPFGAALWSLVRSFDAQCRRDGSSFSFIPQLCDRLVQVVGELLSLPAFASSISFLKYSDSSWMRRIISA